MSTTPVLSEVGIQDGFRLGLRNVKGASCRSANAELQAKYSATERAVVSDTASTPPGGIRNRFSA
jgi:hypothetical protein